MDDVDFARRTSQVRQRVKGSAAFGADLSVESSLHLRAVRSTKPHAKIAIVLDEALDIDGVERIFTAEDIPGRNLFGPSVKDQPVLASERVRCIGEPIALVAAKTEEAAVLAARKVAVTYQDLPAVTDPKAALGPEAPPVHEKGNLLAEYHVTKGDVQRGFDDAEVVVERSYRTTWAEHCYLEPDAGLSYIDESGRVTVVCPTQNPHYDRAEVAAVLSLPVEKVRIIQCATGGGFGGRLDITVQCLLGLAAFHLRRPVRIVYSREEVFQATSKRHPLTIQYKSGARRDGRLTAIEVEILGDTGAYASFALPVGARAAIQASGPYEIPNIKVRSRMVYTNNPWSGAMRGFGVPQVAFAHESQIDLLAQALDIDPIEMRLKNILRPGSKTATGQTLTASVGICETLERVKQWRAQNPLSTGGAGKPYIKRGTGIASILYGIGNKMFANPSTAQIEVDPSGEIRLFSGAADIGQGSDNVLVQIASEAMGIGPEAFSLMRGDTASTTDAGATSASRQTYMSGNAVLKAVEGLNESAIKEASRLFGVAKELLFVQGGRIIQKQDPSLSLSIQEVARLSETVLKGYGTFDLEKALFDYSTGQGTPYQTYAFATHLAEVEVDMQTGRVKVHRVIAAHDVGKVINRTSAVGQIVGGTAMGVGYALMEEFIPGETTSFLNYLIPTAKDVPQVIPILVEESEPTGPFGAKGLGEIPVIASTPAVLNAIADAVGERIYELPAKLERVLQAAQGNPTS